MGDLGVLAAFVIARLCGHLWSRCLPKDVMRYLGFKRILIVRSDHLRRAVFKPLKSACFLGPVSLGPPFGKSQKMGDLGVLAAFVIARLCGHLWSRCLRRDVVRFLGFKCTLIVRSDHLRRAVFKPLKSACFSGQFPFVPPLENLRKWAIWVSLAAFVIARLCGHLWSRCLRQDIVRCLGFKRILIVRSDHLRRAVFKPLKSACFFGQFPLVPPLENLRKWAIWVSLRHLS